MRAKRATTVVRTWKHCREEVQRGGFSCFSHLMQYLRRVKKAILQPFQRGSYVVSDFRNVVVGLVAGGYELLAELLVLEESVVSGGGEEEEGLGFLY